MKFQVEIQMVNLKYLNKPSPKIENPVLIMIKAVDIPHIFLFFHHISLFSILSGQQFDHLQ